MKLENRMAFYFKDTNKNNLLTEEDEKHDRKNNFCRFCEKEIIVDKVRDHCLLTGEYRGPAYKKCNVNVTQKESIFIPLAFHNFSKYDYHLFFKRLVDENR